MCTLKEHEIIKKLEAEGIRPALLRFDNICVLKDVNDNLYLADIHRPHDTLFSGTIKEVKAAFIFLCKHGRLPDEG